MTRSAAERHETAALLAKAEANTKGPRLTPEQTLIVFALVARQGFIAQNDLGVPCDAADRVAMEKAGLIETIKREQNALWLRLSDAGWDFANDNLGKAVPPAHSVVHHLMTRIGDHLRDTNEGLRSFIGAPIAGAMDPELTGTEI